MTIEERITSLEVRAGILLKDDLTFNTENELPQLEKLEREGNLPKGVYRAYASDGEELPYFYKVKREPASREDADRLCELQKAADLHDMLADVKDIADDLGTVKSYVKSIKSWVTFFGVLAVLAMILGGISFILGLSSL